MVTMGIGSRLQNAPRGLKLFRLAFGRSFLFGGDTLAKYKPTEFMAEDSRYDKKAADYAVSSRKSVKSRACGYAK